MAVMRVCGGRSAYTNSRCQINHHVSFHVDGVRRRILPIIPAGYYLTSCRHMSQGPKRYVSESWNLVRWAHGCGSGEIWLARSTVRVVGRASVKPLEAISIRGLNGEANGWRTSPGV